MQVVLMHMRVDALSRNDVQYSRAGTSAAISAATPADRAAPGRSPSAYRNWRRPPVRTPRRRATRAMARTTGARGRCGRIPAPCRTGALLEEACAPKRLRVVEDDPHVIAALDRSDCPAPTFTMNAAPPGCMPSASQSIQCIPRRVRRGGARVCHGGEAREGGVVIAETVDDPEVAGLSKPSNPTMPGSRAKRSSSFRSPSGWSPMVGRCRSRRRRRTASACSGRHYRPRSRRRPGCGSPGGGRRDGMGEAPKI